MLILNAFSVKEIPQWKLETLFRLTENLNAITFEFFSRGPHMKCLRTFRNFEQSDQCKCLYALATAVVTLNRALLEHRFAYFKIYDDRFRAAMKSYLRAATVILCYVRCAWTFHFQKYFRVSMNLLYLAFRYGEWNFYFK
jgi:hypothetical protein